MKTLSLKTPNTVEGSLILEDCDVIEILNISNDYNYSSHLLKVVSDIPFLVFKLNQLVATTTEFTNSDSVGNAYYKLLGTQVNQIIYIKHYDNRKHEPVEIKHSRVLKLSDAYKFRGSYLIIEDIPHLLKNLESYNTIDINLDLSKIEGGSTNNFVIQNTNLKLLDISKVADTFNKFLIYNCYVGNINIVDFFEDKTYSIINLAYSDFTGDICDLVLRYFNNNRFLTIVFNINTTEITLHNKSIIGNLCFLIVINESGATISKGTSLEGPFEETILTYNGSTWEGSWLQ